MLDRAARLARLGTRLVSALAGLLMLALQLVTAIISKPVSGPSLRNIFSLTLRRQL